MFTAAAPPHEIRDPIHGVIRVSPAELAVIEHPFVQRLRGIRQLGFSQLPFPGATHTRYAHSLGALELAGRAFDAALSGAELSRERREAFRSALRLAALCHDLGHPPFSHAVEFAMPSLRAVGVSAYDPALVAHRLDSRASHEDYTIAILTGSSLADTIRAGFPFDPLHIAALVSKEVALPPGDTFFAEGGYDYRSLLSQLVSSELDVDRLDYLVRDSYFTGATYGNIDTGWLISHLSRHVDAAGHVLLALDHRAIYAFDDLMIARFHMFVMVYFHQKSIACEVMLQRYMEAEDCDYRLPADLDGYLQHVDDLLAAHLRHAKNPWARDLVSGRLLRVALEVHGTPGEVHVEPRRRLLEAAGIPAIATTSTGAVFKPESEAAPPIYVLDRGHGRPERVMKLHEATRLFHGYQDARAIARLYVPGDRVEAARELLLARSGP